MQVNTSQRRQRNQKATAYKQKTSANNNLTTRYNDFVPAIQSKLNDSSAVFYPSNKKEEKNNSCVVLQDKSQLELTKEDSNSDYHTAYEN